MTQLRIFSIQELFSNEDTYIIPVYQRNFAWGTNEIKALIQDVYDAIDNKEEYYIGTLVVSRKGNEYEVIDGQQRLTAIKLILSVLRDHCSDNRLTFEARPKSADTLKVLEKEIEDSGSITLNDVVNFRPSFGRHADTNLKNGVENVITSLREVITDDDDEGKTIEDFKKHFLEHVHIIRYTVPEDTDLNHYFEIMNSRGEQLEQHEIVKANLMATLAKEKKTGHLSKTVFAKIWNACSNMDAYIQQTMPGEYFGPDRSGFPKKCYTDILLRFVYEELEKTRSKKSLETKESQDLKDLKNTIRGLVNNSESNSNPSEEVRKNKAVEAYNECCKKPNVEKNQDRPTTIECLITQSISNKNNKDDDSKERFQPIIDFPNLLLIVLKLYLIQEKNSSGSNFSDYMLDDKKLIEQFKNIKNPDQIEKFAYTLLKAKFLLDNYVIHHKKENSDTTGSPWQLLRWKKKNSEGGENEGTEDSENPDRNDNNNTDETIRPLKERIKQLLSMFEVSYSSRQNKNYLFYVLLWLMKEMEFNTKEFYESYAKFLEVLADKFFHEVYLDEDKVNSSNNEPKPGSFDKVMIQNNELQKKIDNNSKKSKTVFENMYGTGTERSKGIPLFVFNYMDYRLWKKYSDELRGDDDKKRNPREEFFSALGCSDFGLEVFQTFYFSRTRNSLEHFFPTANADKLEGRQDSEQKANQMDRINCFGNYAMIGGEINSSGSNWSPATKLTHYLDSSGKIAKTSVASLKFAVMMQKCKDNINKKEKDKEWEWEEIKEHQEKMLNILFPEKKPE